MWSIAGIRIYTTQFSEDTKQSIARLQPIEDGTILHYFGYEDPIIKLSGKVVGKTNYDAIRNLTRSGTGISLVSDLETISCGVNSVSGARDYTIAQTLDINQDCAAPVYTVSLELYKEV